MDSVLTSEGRKEIYGAMSSLFGIGWDSVIKWLVVGFASAWLWLSAFPSVEGTPGRGFAQGPVDWGIDMTESLSVSIPQWILDLPLWLESPDRNWLVVGLPLLASVFATCLVNARRSSGLMVLGVLSILLSVQVSNDFTPIRNMLLFAAIPAIGALLTSVYRRFVPGPHGRRTTHFFPANVAAYYLLFVTTILWQPLIAPVLAFSALVGMYGDEIAEGAPAEKLSRDALAKIKKSGKTFAEADAGDVLGVLSGVSLSVPESTSRRNLAFSLWHELDSPGGSVVKGRD